MAREEMRVSRDRGLVVLRFGSVRLEFDPYKAQALAIAINSVVADIDIPKSVAIEAVIIANCEPEPQA